MLVQMPNGSIVELNDQDIADLQAGKKPKTYSADPILNKLAKVVLKQGQTVLDSQATTLQIWDSLDLNANPVNFNFFVGLQNRSFPLCNIPINRFEDGKAMAVEQVHFFVVKFGTPPNAGIITDIYSLQETAAANGVSNFMGIALGTWSLTIAQQTSIVDMAMTSQLGPQNRAARFGSVGFDAEATTHLKYRYAYSGIHLDIPIIIAPNQNFQLTVNTATYATVSTAGQYRLYCMMTGRGVIAKVQGTN